MIMTSESPLLLTEEERLIAKLERQLDEARDEVARLERALRRIDREILFQRCAKARLRLWWR
jgi:hypothetical protein